MRDHHIFTTVVFHFTTCDVKISSKNQNIAGVTPATLNTKSQGSPNGNPQPDKTGMQHSAQAGLAGEWILAGIHAAADIIVQLLLALFLPSSSTRSLLVYSSGVQRPVAITIVVVVMLIRTNRAGRRTGGIV